MRGGIGRQFRDRARWSRKQRTSDGQGGHTISWTVVESSLPCLRRPGTDRDQVVADQEQAQIEHVVYTFAEKGVRRGDRLELGALVLDVETTWTPSEPRYLAVGCTENQKESP